MLDRRLNRLCARLLFAFAAACATFAAAGVVVSAHQMPMGTPRDHAMPLGAYRFGFLVDPADDHRAMPPAMAALHRALVHAGVMAAMEMPARAASGGDLSGGAGGPFFRTSALDPVQDLGLALALLTALTPRLPRPTRRVLERLTPPSLGLAQWCALLPGRPPRALVRPAATV